MGRDEIIEKEHSSTVGIFEVGDLVIPSGARISLTCPSNDVGIIVETMSDKAYVRTGRTVRVYWQRNKRKAIVNPSWLEKIKI
tara:strand:- start:327 stop:575 length:249 start_codon:yes stop_codon:yes gene_type:complete